MSGEPVSGNYICNEHRIERSARGTTNRRGFYEPLWLRRAI